MKVATRKQRLIETGCRNHLLKAEPLGRWLGCDGPRSLSTKATCVVVVHFERGHARAQQTRRWAVAVRAPSHVSGESTQASRPLHSGLTAVALVCFSAAEGGGGDRWSLDASSARRLHQHSWYVPP